MNSPAEVEKMSVTEFLEWEAQQPQKYELHNGVVYPHEIYNMVDARRTHATIALNIAAALKAHLHGGPCQAFINDINISVDEDWSFYPDVLVTCHPEDLAADLVMRHPTAIIEVLSPSTAAYDRADKFFAYRELASLREYALIDTETRAVEVRRRQENGDWLLAFSDSPRGLVLDSFDFVLPPEALFEDL